MKPMTMGTRAVTGIGDASGRSTARGPVGRAAVFVCALCLAGPGGVAAQSRSRGVAVGQDISCPGGVLEGSLGISGLDCVGGECVLSIWDGGEARAWSFSTEPKILGVEQGSAADGVLEEGDFLVAIDGTLITTTEGGRRYAMLEPGETVRVSYRRSGRVREAPVEVGSLCRQRPEPVGMTVRVAPRPRPPEEPSSVSIAVAPKIRVEPVEAPRATTSGVAVARPVLPDAPPEATGLGFDTRPMGRLGIGFSCSYCGTRTDAETGRSAWFFSGPLEVTAVRPGGAAARAGIQIGDLIRAIDGKAIDTEEGGRAFTDMLPGERVRLAVVKRTGAQVQIGLIPESLEAPPATPMPEVAAVGVVEPLPAAEATEVSVPAAPSAISAPAGMPLRFTGTMDGVEIEVRGRPVTVSEMRGSRTFLINADGLWIRVTLPPGGQPEGR